MDHGIDDFDLVRKMEQRGLTPLWHVREAKARYAWSEGLLKLIGRPTTFKTLLQKTGPGAGGSTLLGAPS
jgi:hypothetical protein